jgi:hypothetical protein
MEKKNPGEDAVVLMEKGKPDEAISVLESALVDEPENYRLVSLLSAATAQKYGISLIDIALKMGGSGDEEEGEEGSESEQPAGGNDITNLFSVLPDPTDANIAGVEEARDIMASIPVGFRKTGDTFMLSLLNTSLLGMRTKKLDTDGDGQLSPVELLDLSEDNATAILGDLISASESFAGESGGAEAAQEKLQAIQDEIDAQEGETEAERLRNYLNRERTGG